MMYDFLNSKPLYYDTIDYLRFPKAFNAIKSNFSLPKVIHIVGTNAKGSTGRFLAQILLKSGKKVGHYTSPHIFKFNERFWINGKNVSDDELELAHEKLLLYFKAVNGCDRFIDELSYFEWATLLFAVLFSGLDEIVCEAGMGGEFDATNVFSKKLSVFTPVGLDHTAMLGDSLEAIATTKLNSMDKFAIVCEDFVCLNLAKKIANSKNTKLILSPKAIENSVNLYSSKFNLPSFLASNLNLAYHSAKFLGVQDLDDIVLNLDALSLRGRCEKIAPNITIDVGHNAHAARALKAEFGAKKVSLVYNAFDDKDIKAVFDELKDIITEVLIYEYESLDRKLAGAKIQSIAKSLGISVSKFSCIDKDKDYLVFGSFVLVEHFIKEVIEK
ncbi:bifunctional folylpolyglutamate synthase/dihydrofolate synthase [Campylobacter hyointestinalis subsp. lawsonii]|nr:bifunctional folylpolyglutamate synthase/dihydrofolate synthase [Campylobacter hyointestinalis subsp. lawsonii]